MDNIKSALVPMVVEQTSEVSELLIYTQDYLKKE